MPEDEGATGAARPAVAGLLPESLVLLGRCISVTHDIVIITEAEPFGEPGPRIVFVNQGFERQTGYRPDEVIGRTPRVFQGPKTDRNELRRIRAALERWEVVRAELVNYAKDGREFCVEMDIVPVADDTGHFTHWVSVQRDVTARKRAEREAHVREAQRVESLGTLAAGIAHDFNNIVGAILGNVSIARQDFGAGGSPLPSLEQIEIAAKRARGLIQQILAYSRRQPEAFVREPLAAIVNEAIGLLRSTLPTGIALTVSVDAAPLDVLADASQLHQVLLNLGTNAWHAIAACDRAEGRIDVDCQAVSPRADGSIDGFDPFRAASGDRCALLTVRDNGCGMDATTCERIFEPYYTTKAIGQGTGLGLSATAGILAAHGARIAVESEPGVGTVFKLLFPLLAPAADGAQPSHPPPKRPGATGERVLLVDDDEVVLLMLQTLLGRAGFGVTAFSDAPAALRAVLARSSDFDIVVTDHNMPGLSGLQLARELARHVPGLPVVIASGYLDDGLRAAAKQAGAAAVVGKEFTADALSDLLRSLRPRSSR